MSVALYMGEHVPFDNHQRTNITRVDVRTAQANGSQESQDTESLDRRFPTVELSCGE